MIEQSKDIKLKVWTLESTDPLTVYYSMQSWASGSSCFSVNFVWIDTHIWREEKYDSTDGAFQGEASDKEDGENQVRQGRGHIHGLEERSDRYLTKARLKLHHHSSFISIHFQSIKFILDIYASQSKNVRWCDCPTTGLHAEWVN